MYGLLEIGAGGSAALVVWLLGSHREILLEPLRWTGTGAAASVTGVAFAAAILLVPTCLMGGTLPVLGRVMVPTLDRLIDRFGLLYAVNTMGGAAGAFLAGFVLFERA